MSEATEYFVRRQGKVEGPWRLDKLRSEVKLRKLARYHEVSSDGVTWERASEIDGLFESAAIRKVVTKTEVAAVPATKPELEREEPSRTDAVPETTEDWYCVIDDEQQGPMTLAELRKMVAGGQLSSSDLVWQDGFADWLPVQNVPQLSPYIGKTVDVPVTAETVSEEIRDAIRVPSQQSISPAVVWIAAVLAILLGIFTLALTIRWLNIS